MGLAIDTFVLAYQVGEDPETADHLREEFAALNQALRAAGHPTYSEPQERAPQAVGREHVGSFPYSWLHYLRRAYAHTVRHPERPLDPLPEGKSAAADPLTQELTSPEHHLLHHSDAEGYYVPVDFPSVIENEDLPGGALGSSPRLLRELALVAPTIDIALDLGLLTDGVAAAIAAEPQGSRFWIERMVWLTLHEQARLSVTFGTAIAFC